MMSKVVPARKEEMWRKMRQQVQLESLSRQALFHSDLQLKCMDIANPDCPLSCIHS
jgi:hypothetical protein